MHGLFNPAAWGSPVGIAIFLAGLGVLFWGIGRLADKKQ